MGFQDLVNQSFPQEREMISDYPNLLSFLPLLYVAWSDDVLTPTESRTIKNYIKKNKSG